MKKWYLFTVTILLSLLLGSISNAQTSFTTGNLVVYQVGNGATLSGNATKVSLVEYTTAGTLVQTIVPDTATAGARLTNLGTSTSEGFLQRSQNTHYLSFGGYDAAAGTVAATYITNATVANDVSRVCAKVGANGIVDYSTKVSGFTGNIRSVYTTDGTAFWASTSNYGVNYVPFGNSGAGTQLSSAPTNTRVTGVFNGQLYVTSSSSPVYGVAAIGSSVPTTSGQSTTLLSGFPANTSAGAHSPYGFAMSPDGNVIYVADDGTPGTTGGGIQKWVLSSGTWIRSDSLSSGTTGVRALTVDWSGYNAGTQFGAVIYAIDASASNANKLVKVTDNGSRNSTFTTLATAPVNTAFRGVAFAPTPLPTLSVTGSLNNFGGVASGSYSSEQTFTVTGANLTGNIVITAPSDFEVSTTTGSGFGSSVTLTPTRGTLSSTTIFVRFHPAGTTGSVSNSITVATNEVTTVNVPVAGVELAAEPTTQSAITFGTVDNSSIVVNLAGGSGANRIVVARAGSAVSFVPTDSVASTGVNSVFTSATDQGNGNKIVYDGTGSTFTVTGLSAGTAYYFASYEYNVGTNNSQNYLTTSPGVNNTTTIASYVWTGATSTDYTVSSNWSPARTATVATDILNFNSGTATTVTAVPTQSVGRVVVSNNTPVTLQAAASSTILTISGGSGVDLSIPAGSALNISGTNTLKLYLSTGATAAINGKMTFGGAAHTFDAKDSAAINFLSGAVFTQGTGATGNVFTNAGQNNSVIFNSGATFIQMAGSNPFALSQPSSKVLFKQGSLFSMQASLTPSLSGRIYADFELNYPTTTTLSGSGSAGTSIDNLIITAGSLNLGMTGTSNYIKGNISVASGASLYFAPATAGTLNLTGSNAQTFAIAGICTTGTNSTIILNNSNGLTLTGGRALTVGGNLTLTSGTLSVGTDTLAISNPLGGTVSNLTADNTTTIILGGSATNVNLPSGITALNNLTLNNTNGTALQNDLAVSGNLTLTSGLLTLGSHNLTLGSATTIVGTPSATAQIVATGSGQLFKNIPDAQSLPYTFTFPVGDNANYTPVALTIVSGSLSSAQVGVNLAASKFAQNTSATDYLKRYWTLSPSGINSGSYNATFTYAATDVAGTEANLYGGAYNAGNWTLLNTANTTTHQISATGISSLGAFTGGQASAFVITPDVPVLASPNNGNYSAVAPLTLKWNKAARAVKYHVEVASDYQFSNLIVNDQTVTDTTKLISVLPNLSQYYWRVSAINLGGESNFSSPWFFSTMGTPTTVTLIQPGNNAVNQPTDITFIWSKAADQYAFILDKKRAVSPVKSPKSPHTVGYYWFELAQDSVSLSGLIRDTMLTDTTKSVTGLSNTTAYYWRVRSQNEAGWSDFTKWNTFMTITSVPDVPALAGPESWSVNNAQPIPVTWYKSARATKYHLQVATDYGFSNIVLNDTAVTDTFRVLSGLQNLKGYYWQVSAINSVGESSTSDTWAFFTIGPPEVATLVQPDYDAVNQPVNVTFIWNKPADQVVQMMGKKHIAKLKKALKKPLLGNSYWFELTTNPDALTGLVRDTLLTDTTKSIANLDNATTFYWRLKSKNSAGWSDFTPWNKFRTIIAIPDVPVLASPANGSNGNAQPVTLKWKKSARADLYRVQVSTDYLFTNLVLNDSTVTDTVRTLPALSDLTAYFWRVSAIDTGGESAMSGTRVFSTIGLPNSNALLQPVDNAVNQPVNEVFVWSKAIDQTLNNADKKRAAKVGAGLTKPLTVSAYWFELAKDSVSLTGLVRDTSVTDTTKSVSGLANATTYFWRVKGKNEVGWGGFTKWNSFTTIVAIPDVPVLASPANKSTGNAIPVTLVWNKSQRVVMYQVQVATDTLFKTIVLNDSTYATDTSRALSSLLNNQTYYWRVSAANVAGISQFSPVFSFTTIVAVPAAPVLVTPVTGSTNTAAALTFSWRKVVDAASYQLQIGTDNAFATVLYDSTTVDTSLDVKALTSKTTYFWRVRSINAAGKSPFSVSSNFTTDILTSSEQALTYSLKQNYPNPFNPTTMITYSIPQASLVTLKVYDVLGKEVATLVNGFQSAGNHNVSFDASHYASGIYFYQIKAGNSVLLKKMILMK